MNLQDKQHLIRHIQLTFIVITSILTISFYTSGCISNKDPFDTPVTSQSSLNAEDNSGIASVIRERFGQTLGQIVAIENYQQASAQAIVTVTMPKPGTARVYLQRRDEKWVIERVQNSIDETDLSGLNE